MSNHLGCNGIIVTSDKRTILIKRSKLVLIGKGTYATNVGASMKAKYALDGHQAFTLPGLKHAILCEIEDQLKIPAEHITDLLFLAAYRDLVEGGKPQLAFAAYTSLTSDDVLANFTESLSRKTAACWDKESMELENSKTLLPIDISDLPHAVISQNAIKVRVGKQSRKLPMMPSAIATIIFFIMYLNNGGIEQ